MSVMEYCKRCKKSTPHKVLGQSPDKQNKDLECVQSVSATRLNSYVLALQLKKISLNILSGGSFSRRTKKNEHR